MTDTFPTSSLDAIGADGAYEIGGGEFTFGQDYTEELIKNMFRLPAPTIGNAIDLLRDNLLKFPIEVLMMFKDLLPDELEGVWDTVEDAVETIIDALTDVPAFLMKLLEWLKIPLLIEVITDHVGDLLSIDWFDSSAIWNAITSAWDFWKGVGNWILAAVESVTGLDILEQADFLKDLVGLLDLDVLQTAWNAFMTVWGGVNWLSIDSIWSGLKAVGNLLRDIFHWFLGVVKNLTTIDLENLADSFGIGGLAAALTAWGTTLAGLNWASPVTALMDAIGAFIQLFKDLGNWVLGVIGSWLGWDTDVVGGMFSGVGSFVEKIVEFFFGETGLAGWLHTIESLVGEAGASIASAIAAVYNGVKRFVDMFGEFTGLAGLVTFFADLFSPDGLLGWLARVKDQITKPPVIDFGFDAIRQKIEEMFGATSVSQINDEVVNLISQGNFNNEITVDAGGGWSWDGSLTSTGTGGSAKCVADGSTQRLFSRQSVRVVAGDRVDVSCKFRTSGFTAAGGRHMVLSIIPWKLVANVMTDQTPVVIGSNSVGSAGAWTAITGTTYEVPTDVVRLTVRLTVIANSGAEVWFDDVTVAKTGKLKQTFVDSLIAAWNDLHRGLTNPLAAATTDKTWQDLFPAASGFRSSYNTEEQRAQTLRTNMFGSPTTVGTEAGLGFIPNIPRTKSTDMQTIINNIWRGLRGESSEDYTAADVYNAAYATQESVAKATAAVADLVAKAASGAFSGVAVAVDFSTLSASSSMPSPWVNTLASLGSPTGSGQLGIGSGRSKWVTSSSDNRQTISIYNSATNTYYQMVTAVYANGTNLNGASNRIYVRSNSTGSTAVYAVFTAFKAELWKVSSGSATRIGVNEWNVSGGNFIFYPGTYKVQAGVGANEDRFYVWQDNRIVIDVTDASAPKSHKLTGIAGDARTYTAGGATRQALPAEVAAFTFHDNTPAATLGSGFHIGRTGGNSSHAASSGAVLNADFFGATPDRISDDLTWSSTNNRVTVSVSGWYMVTLSLRKTMTANTDRDFCSALLVNGSSVYVYGNQQWGLSVFGGDASGRKSTSVLSIPVFLAAGQYVAAGYAASHTTDITGSSGGVDSYFSVAFLGNTKPVQPA